jgi:hypothetical protein
MCMVLKRVCSKQANRVVIIPMIMVRVFGMYVRVVRHFITDEVIAAVPVATIGRGVGRGRGCGQAERER